MKKDIVAKRDWLGIVLTLSIAILIIVALSTLGILRSQGSKCLANPIKAATETVAKQNSENAICTCNGLSKFTKPIVYQTNFTFQK